MKRLQWALSLSIAVHLVFFYTGSGWMAYEVARPASSRIITMDLIQRVPVAHVPVKKKSAEKEKKTMNPRPPAPEPKTKKKIPVAKPVEKRAEKVEKVAKKKVKPQKKIQKPVQKKAIEKARPKSTAQKPQPKQTPLKQAELTHEFKHPQKAVKPITRVVPEKAHTGAEKALTERPVQPTGTGNVAARLPAVIKATPRYQDNPAPGYPPIARRRGYEGTVILEVLVDEEGKVKDLRVYRSSTHNILDRAAIKSVRHWSFEPARQGRQTIAMWVRVPVRFRLQ